LFCATAGNQFKVVQRRAQPPTKRSGLMARLHDTGQRSAPVLGRSNVKAQKSLGRCGRASIIRSCCARGRAHSDLAVNPTVSSVKAIAGNDAGLLAFMDNTVTGAGPGHKKGGAMAVGGGCGKSY
jgi:hypothetical protein